MKSESTRLHKIYLGVNISVQLLFSTTFSNPVLFLDCFIPWISIADSPNTYCLPTKLAVSIRSRCGWKR